MDNRKLKRRHLIYYLRVYDATTDQLIGHLVDITTEGMMLISEQTIPVEKDFKFRMVLPDEIMSKPDILIEARSIWCKKDVNPDFFATGLTILKINQDDLIVVDSLIRKYGFND
jgi:hypothetical protein